MVPRKAPCPPKNLGMERPTAGSPVRLNVVEADGSGVAGDVAVVAGDYLTVGADGGAVVGADAGGVAEAAAGVAVRQPPRWSTDDSAETGGGG